MFSIEKGKKVIPLSENWIAPCMVDLYDGQIIFIGQQEKLRLGNYLGSGIAGVVYEAYENKKNRQVAVKILNPIGYKLFSPQALSKCEIIKQGTIYKRTNLRTHSILKENIWWLVHPNQQELIPCYKDQQGILKEISLDMCCILWNFNSPNDDPLTIEYENQPNIIKTKKKTWKIPNIPKKYNNFLQNRHTIYHEIAHMHRLTGNTIDGSIGYGHENVLKLYDVLEYVQGSKSTIFLILELASGGEFFDRIKFDCGLKELDAKNYFRQLLSGVQYCHQLGIVHRDLKPENLLLSEYDVLKIADFGLSAHFIASVSIKDELKNDIPELPSQFRRLKSVVGSPHYVAPEVLQKNIYGYDGRKADMWSLGVILYTMLVGGLPFGKDLNHCPRFTAFSTWIRLKDDPLNNSFPSFLFPSKLNLNSIDLLCWLLIPEPTKRYSCDEALKSKWMLT